MTRGYPAGRQAGYRRGWRMGVRSAERDRARKGKAAGTAEARPRVAEVARRAEAARRAAPPDVSRTTSSGGCPAGLVPHGTQACVLPGTANVGGQSAGCGGNPHSTPDRYGGHRARASAKHRASDELPTRTGASRGHRSVRTRSNHWATVKPQSNGATCWFMRRTPDAAVLAGRGLIQGRSKTTASSGQSSGSARATTSLRSSVPRAAICSGLPGRPAERAYAEVEGLEHIAPEAKEETKGLIEGASGAHSRISPAGHRPIRRSVHAVRGQRNAPRERRRMLADTVSGELDRAVGRAPVVPRLAKSIGSSTKKLAVRMRGALERVSRNTWLGLALLAAGTGVAIAEDFASDVWMDRPMLAALAGGALLLGWTVVLVNQYLADRERRRWLTVAAAALEDLARVARAAWLQLVVNLHLTYIVERQVAVLRSQMMSTEGRAQLAAAVEELAQRAEGRREIFKELHKIAEAAREVLALWTRLSEIS